MANNGVRRKDTTRGPPLRILSLDGGGVRGYSMFIILQELMHRTFVEIEGRAPKRHEIPKPCDHFDLIIGTGTGGLVAIMLGRLRMDLDTCKDVYVRMTRRVFETDKTFAGIPYRSTLFKASKLEEAIKDCVREHTIYEDEGNDGPDASSSADLRTPSTPRSAYSSVQRSPSTTSRYSTIGNSNTPVNLRMQALKWGNPNALLYDTRENRTKTAVTAVYKGSRRSGNGQILLRSYDSRKEPSPEYDCTIWEAGRATCATALAFKPIQIGQSTFLDDGAGKYNPAPMALDEAVCNEWPGREVGVFISLGTGKRPPGTDNQQHAWWEGFVSSGVGDFAEARRRLISKIEDCERTHMAMKDHLAKRQVNPENYYRLNVNVGVGEFGMNEWHRLAEISTNTRMYLAESEVQSQNLDAAAKLARIHRAKDRWERSQRGEAPFRPVSYDDRPFPTIPSPSPLAVELPAEEVTPSHFQHPDQHLLTADSARHPSDADKFVITPDDQHPPRTSYSGDISPYRRSAEHFSDHSSPRLSFEEQRPPPPRQSPPPRPPKTPLQRDVKPAVNRHGPPQGVNVLPYPDTDGPPPVVNVARKPEYGVR